MSFNFKAAAAAIVQTRAERGIVMITKTDGQICLHEGVVMPVPEGMERYVLILMGPNGEERFDCTSKYAGDCTWPLEVLHDLEQAGVIQNYFAMWRAGQLYNAFREKVMRKFIMKHDLVQHVMPNLYPATTKGLIIESVVETEPEWDDDASTILRNFIVNQLFMKLAILTERIKRNLLGGRPDDPNIPMYVAQVEAYWKN